MAVLLILCIVPQSGTVEGFCCLYSDVRWPVLQHFSLLFQAFLVGCFKAVHSKVWISTNREE